MCFLFGGTRPCPALHPFDFLAQNGLSFPFACPGNVFPLLFGCKISGIVCLIAVNLSFIDFHNPVAYTVQKIPVMCHHNHCSPVIFQIIFQPLHRFQVQMVRRLIQKQYITRSKEHCNKSQSFPLSAGQMSHRFIEIVYAKPRHHGFGIAFQIPFFMFFPVFLLMHTSNLRIRKYILKCSFLRVKFRHLRQIANHKMIGPYDISGIRFFESCHNF